MNEQPSWKNRRRVIFGTLGFCALTLSIPIFRGDAAMVEALAPSYSLLVAGIVGSYVFGAAWQDINLSKPKKREPGRMMRGE